MFTLQLFTLVFCLSLQAIYINQLTKKEKKYGNAYMV